MVVSVPASWRQSGGEEILLSQHWKQGLSSSILTESPGKTSVRFNGANISLFMLLITQHGWGREEESVPLRTPLKVHCYVGYYWTQSPPHLIRCIKSGGKMHAKQLNNKIIPVIPSWGTFPYSFDHLLMCNFKLLSWKQEGGQDSSLRVGMDHCACSCRMKKQLLSEENLHL